VAVGALRAALGIASNERDVDRLVEILAGWTVDAEAPGALTGRVIANGRVRG
jgi:hypothetical protein